MRVAVPRDMGEHARGKARMLALDAQLVGCTAGMQQRLRCRRHHPVHVQIVFGQRELRVAAIEVADAVAGTAMAQHEVRCTRRRPDGIELHEPGAMDRRQEVGCRRRGTGDGVRAQCGERRHTRRHAAHRMANDGTRVVMRRTLWRTTVRASSCGA